MFVKRLFTLLAGFLMLLAYKCLGCAVMTFGLLVLTALCHLTVPDAHTVSAFAAYGGYFLAGACVCAYYAHQCRREGARR